MCGIKGLILKMLKVIFNILGNIFCNLPKKYSLKIISLFFCFQKCIQVHLENTLDWKKVTWLNLCNEEYLNILNDVKPLYLANFPYTLDFLKYVSCLSFISNEFNRLCDFQFSLFPYNYIIFLILSLKSESVSN